MKNICHNSVLEFQEEAVYSICVWFLKNGPNSAALKPKKNKMAYEK